MTDDYSESIMALVNGLDQDWNSIELSIDQYCEKVDAAASKAKELCERINTATPDDSTPAQVVATAPQKQKRLDMATSDQEPDTVGKPQEGAATEVADTLPKTRRRLLFLNSP